MGAAPASTALAFKGMGRWWRFDTTVQLAVPPRIFTPLAGKQVTRRPSYMSEMPGPEEEVITRFPERPLPA